MKANDMHATIAHLHSVYCAASGMVLRLGLMDYSREWGWTQFINAGFTDADIHTVCGYLKRKIAKGERQPGSLKWSNTIGSLDRFEEDLALALAEQRNAQPKTTPRQRAMEQLRPTIVRMTPEAQKNTAKHVSEYVAELRRAAQ